MVVSSPRCHGIRPGKGHNIVNAFDLCLPFVGGGCDFIVCPAVVASASGHGGDIAVGILQQVSLDLFEIFCLNSLLLPADHLHFPIHTLRLLIEPDATVAALRNMMALS